jgi:hypothetical protein
LGLPTLLLPSGLLIYSFFDDPVFWHPFYGTQPSQSCFLDLCDSDQFWYSAISSLFVLILQIPLSHTGPQISLNTFLSHVRINIYTTF